MKRHQTVWLVAFVLLVLAPVQAEATSHTTFLTKLCTWIDCVPALTIPPKIDQVLTFTLGPTPIITPGGMVTIKGSAFGYAEGELYLKGLKNYNGVDLRPVKIPIATEPGKDFWNPTSVLGIPGTITEVTDQPAKLQIKTKDNRWSNEFPVNFKATRDIKVLTESDVHSTSCSPESDYDSCTGVPLDWNVIPFCNSPLGVYYPAGTFKGFHWTCVGDSDGDDSFRFSLREKYGWSLYGGADLYYSTGGVDQPVITSGSQAWGVTYTKVSLHWNNATVSYVLYIVNVSIIGPKGVPHY